MHKAITHSFIFLLFTLISGISYSAHPRDTNEQEHLDFMLDTAYDYFHGTETIAQNRKRAFAICEGLENDYLKAKNLLWALLRKEADEIAEQNPKLARSLYKAVADKGCPTAKDTLNHLWKPMLEEAIKYAKDTGVPKNEDHAFSLFLALAKEGCTQAMLEVAYYHNKAKDKVAAFKWYLQAAKDNNAKAQVELSYFYYFGTGVEQNYNKAYQYALEADISGNPDGTYLLGYYSEFGIGTEIDLPYAITNYKEAARNNSKFALKALHRLKGDGNKKAIRALKFL